MSYKAYCEKYYKLIARLVRLGLKYARKTFWKLTARQYVKYHKGQFAAMRKAVKTLKDWQG